MTDQIPELREKIENLDGKLQNIYDAVWTLIMTCFLMFSMLVLKFTIGLALYRFDFESQALYEFIGSLHWADVKYIGIVVGIVVSDHSILDV